MFLILCHCRISGPGEAKSRRSVCYPAWSPKPQAKLKKAIQGDTELAGNSIANTHRTA